MNLSIFLFLFSFFFKDRHYTELRRLLKEQNIKVVLYKGTSNVVVIDVCRSILGTSVIESATLDKSLCLFY